MLLGNIINDSFGMLSRQLRFYCWHYRRNLDHRQRQELIDVLNEQHFERLSAKIKSLYQNNIADCKQQITKLLFEQCLAGHRRHQLIQLIESDLLDLDVRLDNYGRTMLHRMAYILDVELVKLLIDHGVNIRLRDYAGNTALHIAIQSYRNGALIYNNNEPNVVENLKTIITFLLEADRHLVIERLNRKRIRTNEFNPRELNCSHANIKSEVTKFIDESLKHSKSSESIYNHKESSKRNAKESQLQFESSNRSYELVKHDHFNEENGTKKTLQSTDCSPCPIRPLLMEDLSSSLVDTKNAFGRTALHYCVLVVGEQHIGDLVELLISFGADTNAIDTRLKTPLYCLVRRPGVSAIRQKCMAIKHLLRSGCDDLGLAIDPEVLFTEKLMSRLEMGIPTSVQDRSNPSLEPIFTQSTFKRVPNLKHLARLALIKLNADQYIKLGAQSYFVLPAGIPPSLSQYLNRKILDQSELF